MIPSAPRHDIRPYLMLAALLLMGGLLFVRLGHYPLWDDETMVGLAAQGVMRTGDTSVRMDHGNLVAYRAGILVRNFHDRSTPPLATYLTAASFALFGVKTWAARLPFALLGLATVALILYAARRESWPTLFVLITGLLCNVSLILYFRQCRYYGPNIFFTVAIVFVYWRWKPTPRHLLVLAALSFLLFASNYMNYLAVYLCLAVDYALWKRRESPPTWRNALLLFGPQVVLNGALACVWNPFRTHEADYEAVNHLRDRLVLFGWFWRDLNQCEFFAVSLLLLAFIVGWVKHRPWLVRGCVAILVYVTTITLVSPEFIQFSWVADVRYMPALIPLGIVLETGLLCTLLARKKSLLCLAAIVVFGTNLCHGGWLLGTGFRSTILCYLGELLDPPPEPYSPTAQWINHHVPAGDSVWVLPNYATYPLMFYAPRALYAWQLNWPPRSDFAHLPLIHFIKQEPPDYLVAFGPYRSIMERTLADWHRPGLSYRPVATLPVLWKDMYRPELFLRIFRPMPIGHFDPRSQLIYIFQRNPPPPSATGPQQKSLKNRPEAGGLQGG